MSRTQGNWTDKWSLFTSSPTLIVTLDGLNVNIKKILTAKIMNYLGYLMFYSPNNRDHEKVNYFKKQDVIRNYFPGINSEHLK
jgi:hypothetical protein